MSPGRRYPLSPASLKGSRRPSRAPTTPPASTWSHGRDGFSPMRYWAPRTATGRTSSSYATTASAPRHACPCCGTSTASSRWRASGRMYIPTASSSTVCSQAPTAPSGRHIARFGQTCTARCSRECCRTSIVMPPRWRPRPSMHRCGWMQSGGTADTPASATIWTRQGRGSVLARNGWTSISPRR